MSRPGRSRQVTTTLPSSLQLWSLRGGFAANYTALLRQSPLVRQASFCFDLQLLAALGASGSGLSRPRAATKSNRWASDSGLSRPRTASKSDSALHHRLVVSHLLLLLILQAGGGTSCGACRSDATPYTWPFERWHRLGLREGAFIRSASRACCTRQLLFVSLRSAAAAAAEPSRSPCCSAPGAMSSRDGFPPMERRSTGLQLLRSALLLSIKSRCCRHPRIVAERVVRTLYATAWGVWRRPLFAWAAAACSAV